MLRGIPESSAGAYMAISARYASPLNRTDRSQRDPCAARRYLTIALAVATLSAAPLLSHATEQAAISKGPATAQLSRSPTGQVSQHPSAGQPEAQANAELLVAVLDENGVAVPFAHVILTQQEGQVALKGETDYAGRREFTGLSPGIYSLRVEKEGFYAVHVNDVRVGEVGSVEISFNHVREFTEVVDVVYSPPSIDPAKTSAGGTLNSQEIVNVPYTVTRDIRYALPLMAGIVQDAFGQIHLAGSSTRQVFDQLDGFNISDPTTGLFNLRVSVDALQSVDVQSSRYSTEYGKGSGGVLSLRTGMGDNHLRFSATDFIPSLQSRKGIHINTWTPRATLSGPLRKNKAWFLEALDGEYGLTIVKELPTGADRNPTSRISNLSKVQVNLSPANILTTSFLVNGLRSDHVGLGPFSPLETTVNQTDSAYLFTLKDQHLFSGGVLLEAGVGISEFHGAYQPLGSQTYVITPERTSGNYFETADGQAGRVQGIANLFLPPLHRSGRHEFKMGVDVERVTDRQSSERRPFLILREDATLSRKIDFAGGPSFSKNNFEVSGYAQDRWSLSDRWLVEPGIRLDWDAVIRDVVASPRLASTYLLSRNGDAKLAAGIGIYHDATNLDILTRSLTGQRFDLFYDETGQTLLRPPVETSFQANERELRMPRFLNWSLGLERKMLHSIYLRAQFVQKRGRDGWTFINAGANQAGGFSGHFALRNERRDRYDSLEVILRRMFKGNHVVFASYTRSSARSNAVLNFNIDSPLFSQQAGGPFAWDTPNRLISWGWLPLPRHFDLAYALDWRDGYPFSLVNQDQQLVGSPGSRRFPTYFSLNLHVERRFRLFGFLWALRAGFDDITGRQNPSWVDNNVDSPHFLTFAGVQGRALTGRIRLLGRK